MLPQKFHFSSNKVTTNIEHCLCFGNHVTNHWVRRQGNPVVCFFTPSCHAAVKCLCGVMRMLYHLMLPSWFVLSVTRAVMSFALDTWWRGWLSLWHYYKQAYTLMVQYLPWVVDSYSPKQTNYVKENYHSFTKGTLRKILFHIRTNPFFRWCHHDGTGAGIVSATVSFLRSYHSK
jgi:hypothetical protein